MNNRERVAAVIAAAVLALALYLPYLGEGALTGDDEAYDAAVVWEMAENGEWLFPELTGGVLPPKPPLFYWAAAVVAEARGRFDETSLRLPSAIFATGTVALTAWAGSALVSPGAGCLAGALLAVMPIFYDQARLGRADMTMTFFTTAALLVFLFGGDPLPNRRRWLFWALLGLAAAAKGAAAVGLVVSVLGASALFGVRRAAARSLVGPEIVAFVAIGGSWYVLASFHWGSRFVERHVLGENARHFFGGLVSGESPTRTIAHHATHLVNVFVGTAPWGFALPSALLAWWRERPFRPDPARDFLAVWVGAGLVFFTLATRKSPYYLLPIFPAIALLVSGFAWPRVHAALEAGSWRRFTVRSAGISAGAAALVIVGAMLAADLLPPGLAEAVFARPSALWVVLAVVLLLLSVAVLAARDRDWGGAALLGCALGAAALTLANLVAGPLANEASLKRFALVVRDRVPAEKRVAFFRFPLPAVALYAERSIHTVDATAIEGNDYLIVPGSLTADLPAAVREGSSVVAEEEARVFTRKRMPIRLLKLGGHATDRRTREDTVPAAGTVALRFASGAQDRAAPSRRGASWAHELRCECPARLRAPGS